MKFDIHHKIKYVPLPIEHEAAWREAMLILIEWLKEDIESQVTVLGCDEQQPYHRYLEANNISSGGYLQES